MTGESQALFGAQVPNPASHQLRRQPRGVSDVRAVGASGPGPDLRRVRRRLQVLVVRQRQHQRRRHPQRRRQRRSGAQRGRPLSCLSDAFDDLTTAWRRPWTARPARSRRERQRRVRRARRSQVGGRQRVDHGQCGQRRERQRGGERRRPVHRVPIARQQSGAGRYEQRLGRVPARSLRHATTRRINVGWDGQQATPTVDSPAISMSANGDVIAFATDDGYLTNPPTWNQDFNNALDVVVYDRYSGSLTRVDIGSNGELGNGNTYWPTLSEDGQYVSLVSTATNVDMPVTPGRAHVYVYDRFANRATRVERHTRRPRTRSRQRGCGHLRRRVLRRVRLGGHESDQRVPASARRDLRRGAFRRDARDAHHSRARR